MSAELVPDPDRPRAWTLLVDGTAQSHVDLGDPTHLEFEYVRWLGRVVDAVAPGGVPISVLHLGGGAWTLARYVSATRPRSRQRVVELDPALVELVRQRLPSAGSGIRVRIGDARQVLGTLVPNTADLIVLDAFRGARIPAHLTSLEFLRSAVRVLRAGGSYALNLADGAPLAFARSQAATVGELFEHLALIGPPAVLRGRRFGNVVILGSAAELPVAELSRRTAADPFPPRVVGGEDVARFIAGARPVTDDSAGPSPAPPGGLLGGRIH